MFIDTSIIIEIINNDLSSDRSKRIFQIIDEEILSISVIQLGEVADWHRKNGMDPGERIELLKDIVKVIPLDERTVLEGSGIKHQRRTEGHSKFCLVDGIILASAMEMNETLLTLDSDFRDLENVILLSG